MQVPILQLGGEVLEILASFSHSTNVLGVVQGTGVSLEFIQCSLA
jgi:hypothetical protein